MTSMQQLPDGDFLVTSEEMRILRAGLFITVYHLDPAFEEDLHSITGFDADVFERLMGVIDEAR